MSGPTVRELRAGRTPAGEVRHACWVTAGETPYLLPLSLCGRYQLVDLHPAWLGQVEPTCLECIRAVRAADKDAVWVMVNGEPGGHPTQQHECTAGFSNVLIGASTPRCALEEPAAQDDGGGR